MRAQRDRVLEFIRLLLRALEASSEQQRVLLDQLLHSARIPNIESVPKSARVFFANAYSITLDTSKAAKYPKGLVSNSYGTLDAKFHGARKAVRDRLMHMDEIASAAETALQHSSPALFLAEFDRRLRGGDLEGSEAASAISELRQALYDVDTFLERLESVGERERYLRLVQSLGALENDVADYIQGCRTAEIELAWQIAGDGSDQIVCLYDRPFSPQTVGFTTKHGREVRSYSKYRYAPRTRHIEAADVIEDAQFELARIFERLVPTEP